ncbi:MAG: hypothetical protein M3R01_05790 [Actinomycetota bacterium]|nr:hypothetical protein [Actinomycetota bacterium]
MAWAAVVLARPTRTVLALGVAVNTVIVVGYVLSRTSGISFVDGLQEAERVVYTDAVTTGFEVVLVIGAVLALAVGAKRRLWPSGGVGTAGLSVLGLVLAGLAVPAALYDQGQDEDQGQDVAEANAAVEAGEGVQADTAALHPPGHTGPFEGVTPEQQAQAAQLLADTKAGLWQWNDPATLEEAGFRTINDGGTGTEHFIQWDWIDDDVVLDPNKPESLVFRVTPQGRALEAAMFLLPPGTPDEEIPDVGGPLTQWHIHDNLCFGPEQITNGAKQRVVVGLQSRQGTCGQGVALPESQMLHVWVVQHPCGPFSELEGIGAGREIQEPGNPNESAGCKFSLPATSLAAPGG